MLPTLVQNIEWEWKTKYNSFGDLQSVGLIEGPNKKLFCLSLLQMSPHSYFSSAKIYLPVGYPRSQSITADNWVQLIKYLISIIDLLFVSSWWLWDKFKFRNFWKKLQIHNQFLKKSKHRASSQKDYEVIILSRYNNMHLIISKI